MTELVRGLREGEVARVYFSDCKETVLRNIVHRLKREGLVYQVNAVNNYCLITRLA